MARALIVIDLQNDFLPGGALAVPAGDEVIPVANQLLPKFEHVFVTQDWHPSHHGSFAANHPHARVGDVIELDGLPQILWPTHCVQGTVGADFAAGLTLPASVPVIRKGTDPAIDSYSGFFDNGHRQPTGLEDLLRRQDITDVYLMGLATDYCVKFSALDANQLGFRTHLVVDGCRGVNLQPQDVEQALAEMQDRGVKLVTSYEITAEG